MPLERPPAGSSPAECGKFDSKRGRALGPPCWYPPGRLQGKGCHARLRHHRRGGADGDPTAARPSARSAVDSDSFLGAAAARAVAGSPAPVAEVGAGRASGSVGRRCRHRRLPAPQALRAAERRRGRGATRIRGGAARVPRRLAARTVAPRAQRGGRRAARAGTDRRRVGRARGLGTNSRGRGGRMGRDLPLALRRRAGDRQPPTPVPATFGAQDGSRQGGWPKRPVRCTAGVLALGPGSRQSRRGPRANEASRRGGTIVESPQ